MGDHYRLRVKPESQPLPNTLVGAARTMNFLFDTEQLSGTDLQRLLPLLASIMGPSDIGSRTYVVVPRHITESTVLL